MEVEYPFLFMAVLFFGMLLGVFIPIVAVMSLFVFILYMISNKTIKFMCFFYGNLFIALVLSICFWWFRGVLGYLVDIYCFVYIVVMFFVVLRGIFSNKNVRMLDYAKISIPLFLIYVYLFIKINMLIRANKMSYAVAFAKIILKAGASSVILLTILPISFLLSVSLLLLTKHAFKVAKKEEVYSKNEKAIRIFYMFLFIVFLGIFSLFI